MIISAGLTISMLYVTRRATYLVDRDVYTLGNYFGYALVTLLYALAEPKKAKK